ncbi:unnamed protein product [Cuscuta epithymum]|uniref:Uncharacterized protein n=1 Tax=Cuscuta epithymum TaxID=186058 RepID=A0AAV0CQD2_9ASTE|nr:unnamed protein product [Cuscuta epithymum]
MGTSGAVSSSMMLDSHSSLCPCLVVPASCNLSSVDLGLHRYLSSTSLPGKQIKSLGSLELSYSFLGPRVLKKGQRGHFKSLKKQQAKKRGSAVENEFGGQYEDAFEDVKSIYSNKQA